MTVVITSRRLMKRMATIKVEYYSTAEHHSRIMIRSDKQALARRLEAIMDDHLSGVVVLDIKQKRMEKN